MDPDVFGGSILAKWTFNGGVSIMLFGVFSLFGGSADFGLMLLVAGFVVASCAYFIAGGARNPALYDSSSPFSGVDYYLDQLLAESEAEAAAAASDPLVLSKCLVHLCVAMAAADGETEPDELMAIIEFFRAIDAPPMMLLWVEQEIYTTSEFINKYRIYEKINRVASSAEKEMVLVAMASVAFSDGRLHPEELKLLKSVASALSYPYPELRLLLLGMFGVDLDDPSGQTAREEGEVEQALAVLGLSPGASSKEIKSAHRSLAKQFHPDKASHRGPEFEKIASERMTRVNWAHDVLSAANSVEEQEGPDSRAASNSTRAPSGSSQQESVPDPPPDPVMPQTPPPAGCTRISVRTVTPSIMGSPGHLSGGWCVHGDTAAGEPVIVVFEPSLASGVKYKARGAVIDIPVSATESGFVAGTPVFLAMGAAIQA